MIFLMIFVLVGVEALRLGDEHGGRMQLVPGIGDAKTTGDLVAVEDVKRCVAVHNDAEGVRCGHHLERAG
jgi:hypothetical protein